MKKTIVSAFLFCLLCALIAGRGENASAFASEDTSKAEYLIGKGTNLYVEGEYKKALGFFTKASKHIQNGYLFYNIGNCFFRLHEKGKALAAYRKAERYIPDMVDLNKNIAFLLKGQDASFKKPELFASARYVLPFYESFSVDTIALCVLVFLSFTALFSILYLYGRKRQFFWLSSFFGVLMILMSISFTLHYYERGFIRFGVIISKNAEVKSERTADSVTLFKLPELAEFRTLSQNGRWLKIEIIDHKTGWVSLDDARTY